MSFPCDFHSEGVGFGIERDRLTLRCSREEIVNADEHEPQMALAEEKVDYARIQRSKSSILAAK